MAARWPQGLHIAAATNRARMSQVASRVPVPRIELYTDREERPIGNGTAQVILDANGNGTASVGPQGLGTLWWPSALMVSTLSGTLDNSVVQLYSGPLASPTSLSAQSYAGGGDTIGLAGIELQPGEFLIASWSGGVPGDTATMLVRGVESWLLPA